jgi:hypothetical protein
MLMLASAGKEQGESGSYRMSRGIQDFGFVIDKRYGIVGGNEADAQQQERNYLLRDFIRFALADRHG